MCTKERLFCIQYRYLFSELWACHNYFQHYKKYAQFFKSFTGNKYWYRYVFNAGLWIRIQHLSSIRIRIRIQHLSSIRIRIRIHEVIESGSNADPDPQSH
jgi:hypothetical protein